VTYVGIPRAPGRTSLGCGGKGGAGPAETGAIAAVAARAGIATRVTARPQAKKPEEKKAPDVTSVASGAVETRQIEELPEKGAAVASDAAPPKRPRWSRPGAGAHGDGDRQAQPLFEEAHEPQSFAEMFEHSPRRRRSAPPQPAEDRRQGEGEDLPARRGHRVPHPRGKSER